MIICTMGKFPALDSHFEYFSRIIDGRVTCKRCKRFLGVEEIVSKCIIRLGLVHTRRSPSSEDRYSEFCKDHVTLHALSGVDASFDTRLCCCQIEPSLLRSISGII